MLRSLKVALGFGALSALLGGCGSSTSADPFAGGSSATAGTSGGSATAGATGVSVPTSGATAGSTAGTAGATSAGTAGTAGSGDAGLCGTTNVGAQGGAANLLLVIDKSTSMTEMPFPMSRVTKWQALQMGLPPALATAPAGLSLGLMYLPSGGNAGCNVAMGNAAVTIPVGPQAMTLMPIDNSIAMTMPNGSTPTAAALRAALAYYSTGGGAALTGDKYVLLATDGAPNCNGMITCPNTAPQCTNIGNNTCNANGCLDDVATVAAVASLATAGVKTFVVGIPGSEAYASVLDQMAMAGGEPTTNPGDAHVYYEVTAAGGAAGLQMVLSSIVGSVKITSCNLQLNQTAATGYTLAVYVNGMLTTINTDWTLDTTTTPPTVVLQGATCQNVMTNGADSVKIQVFCPGAVPPPRIN